MQVASYVVFDQYRPRNLLASALLLLLFGFATACCAEQGAVVNLSANAISATAAVDGVSTMSIRVAGPGDFWDEARTTSGRVEWTLPADAVDGFYRYDVYVSVEGASAQEDEDRDRDEKEEAGGGRLLRQSGRFDVENGVISAPEPGQEEASAGSGAVVPELGGIVRQIVGGLLDFVFPAAHAADLNAHSVSPTVWYVAVVPGSPSPILWWSRNRSKSRKSSQSRNPSRNPNRNPIATRSRWSRHKLHSCLSPRICSIVATTSWLTRLPIIAS